MIFKLLVVNHMEKDIYKIFLECIPPDTPARLTKQAEKAMAVAATDKAIDMGGELGLSLKSHYIDS